MKRFNFKLANVLKYRETLETLAKNAYREALHLLNIEKDKLMELERRRDELKTAYNIKAGSVIDPESLSFLSFYTAQLVYLIEKRKEIVREKEEIAREKFEEWNSRRKDVKVIKRLEEKKWREYLREADKEEQKFQDEIFIAKTVRGMER
jgi:flagellar export protein FliJ